MLTLSSVAQGSVIEKVSSAVSVVTFSRAPHHSFEERTFFSQQAPDRAPVGVLYIMDSLADHSLISRIITVADVVDQIISHVWLHRWNLLLALPHYIFFAKPVDLYLLLLTSAYNYRARIALWSLDGPSLQAAAAFFTVVISTCFVLPHFISANQRNELGSRLGPVIIPGRTTHTRLFPKTHKFSYPYLMVAVPVGLRGNINCLLSLDEDTKQLNTWQRWAMLATPYKVDGQDYLERRECAGGLRGKLDYFLKSKVSSWE